MKHIVIVMAASVMIAFSLTKIIYDAVFDRPEGGAAAVSLPDELDGVIAARRRLSFVSGEYDLCGYLYGGDGGTTLVVVAPGFMSTSDAYLWQIKSFLDSGFGVFAFDSTGSGESEGDSAVGFSQELCDLDAALSYIEQQSAFGYSSIVLFGHSRGGYAACCVLDYGHDVSAVVSVSGVNSAMEGVMAPAVERIGVLAYVNYPILWLYQVMLFGEKAVNADAALTISDSEVPVLVIHGADDRHVPADGCAIIAHREEITSDRVEYIICDEAGRDGHTNLMFGDDGRANDRLMGSISEFYARSTGG